jgi:hypothetical protein
MFCGRGPTRRGRNACRNPPAKPRGRRTARSRQGTAQTRRPHWARDTGRLAANPSGHFDGQLHARIER